MGTALTHALSRERKVYLETESTFGTRTFPAGTDAAKVLAGTSFGNPAIERHDRADNRTTRSQLERITGKQGPHEFTIEADIIPSGTAGTPPDLHEAYKAAMGAYNNTPGTSDAYTLSDTQGAHGSLTITEQTSAVHAESIAGAVIQSMALKGGGTEPPTVTFAGQAADHVTTGVGDLKTALSGSETQFVLDPHDVVEVGSLIKIGDSDNSGDGHQVTAKGAGIGDAVLTGSGLDDATSGGTYTGSTDKDFRVQIDSTGTPDTFKWSNDGGSTWEDTAVACDTSPVTLEEGVTVTFGATTGHTVDDYWDFDADDESLITVTPAVAGAQAIDVDIVPQTPDETTAGSPLPGITGSVTIDGDTVPVLAWEVTINNNHVLFHDEAFQQKVTDYAEGYREASGQLSFRARSDLVKWLGIRKALETHAIVITIGSTAGKICTISLPYVEFEFADAERSNEDASMINLPFRALGSSGADELTVTFT